MRERAKEAAPAIATARNEELSWRTSWTVVPACSSIRYEQVRNLYEAKNRAAKRPAFRARSSYLFGTQERARSCRTIPKGLRAQGLNRGEDSAFRFKARSITQA